MQVQLYQNDVWLLSVICVSHEGHEVNGLAAIQPQWRLIVINEDDSCDNNDNEKDAYDDNGDDDDELVFVGSRQDNDDK